MPGLRWHRPGSFGQLLRIVDGAHIQCRPGKLQNTGHRISNLRLSGSRRSHQQKAVGGQGMCPVDLDDRLDDSLLYLLHAVKLLVQNPPGLFRVNGLKIIVLPLNIHHNRERALGMTALLGADLAGAGHCQIPAGPELDVVRKGPACAGHEVCDASEDWSASSHRRFPPDPHPPDPQKGRCWTEAAHHKLQKSVLRRKLGASSEGRLADSIDRIAVRPVLSGKAHVDTMLSKPFHQAYKTARRSAEYPRSRRLPPP